MTGCPVTELPTGQTPDSSGGGSVSDLPCNVPPPRAECVRAIGMHRAGRRPMT